MKIKNTLSLIALILFLSNCGTADEPEAIDTTETLVELGMINEKEVFNLKVDQDTLILLDSGLGVYITENSFIDKQGNVIEGEIELVTKDVFDFYEMYIENISTVSPNGLLETKGMIEINAFQNNVPIQLGENKGINLIFPGDSLEYAGAQVFYGYENEMGAIEWKEESEENSSPRGINWEEEIELNFAINYNYYDDLIKEKGFFQTTPSFVDSLRLWIDLSEKDKEILSTKTVLLYWTLFDDGDFEIYYIKGDVSKRLKKILKDKFNAIPKIAPFHREGGLADVSGVISVFTQSKVNRLIDNFSIISYELGWINCDVFLRIDKPLIDMIVKVPNDKTIIKLAFKNYKTIVMGVLKDDGNVYFSGIPENEEIDIIAIFEDENKTFLSITEARVSEKIINLELFEETDVTEIEKRLNEVF